MPVINNGMKSCNSHRGDGLHLASAFTVTVVSQDVGDAASQTCGVRSLAASTLTLLVNVDIPTNVTNLQEEICRAIQLMWSSWLSTLCTPQGTFASD